MKHLLIVAALLAGCATEKQKTMETQSTVVLPSKTPEAKAETPKAKAETNEQKEYSNLEVRCKHNTDDRTLVIVPKDAGCALYYSKSGTNTVLARSKVGTQYCENVQAQVKKNLEAAGFSCQ